jgi:arginyl-tRNA synthetase
MKVLKFDEYFTYYADKSENDNEKILLKKLQKRDGYKGKIVRYTINYFVKTALGKLEERHGFVNLNEYPDKETIKKFIQKSLNKSERNLSYIYIYKEEKNLEVSSFPNEMIREIVSEIELEEAADKYNL